MRKNLSTFLTVSVMSLTAMMTAVPGVLAQNSQALDRANARAQERMDLRQQPTSSPTTSLQRSCEARQEAVVKRMSQLVQLAEKIQAAFDRHATRVQEYYLNTVVPAGLTVDNYDELLADIAAKKAVVQTTIANAQTDVDEFSCDTADPRTYLTTFRTDMQAVKSALKEYRTSIKNLIVAVSRVAQDLETPTPTPSPTPSATPSPTASPTL
jgi:DNA repair ATPase RecN